jgi:hypothetical protein
MVKSRHKTILHADRQIASLHHPGEGVSGMALTVLASKASAQINDGEGIKSWSKNETTRGFQLEKEVFRHEALGYMKRLRGPEQ